MLKCFRPAKEPGASNSNTVLTEHYQAITIPCDPLHLHQHALEPEDTRGTATFCSTRGTGGPFQCDGPSDCQVDRPQIIEAFPEWDRTPIPAERSRSDSMEASSACEWREWALKKS